MLPRFVNFKNRLFSDFSKVSCSCLKTEIVSKIKKQKNDFFKKEIVLQFKKINLQN